MNKKERLEQFKYEPELTPMQEVYVETGKTPKDLQGISAKDFNELHKSTKRLNKKYY